MSWCQVGTHTDIEKTFSVQLVQSCGKGSKLIGEKMLLPCREGVIQDKSSIDSLVSIEACVDSVRGSYAMGDGLLYCMGARYLCLLGIYLFLWKYVICRYGKIACTILVHWCVEVFTLSVSIYLWVKFQIFIDIFVPVGVYL